MIGVDVIFTLSYLHILKKIYLKNYTGGDLDGWFTGAYAFLLFHGVVFLGIALNSTHLADVTIMILANMVWSLSGRCHRIYALLFLNRHASSDLLLRFAALHYGLAFYYLHLVQAHVVHVHEAWEASAAQSTRQDSTKPKASWGWDAIKKELTSMFVLYKLLAVVFVVAVHPDSRVLSFSFFEQWNETEVEEANFYIVAPHWYFRAHMGLLTACPRHYEGLGWLAAFFLLLCYLPHVFAFWNPQAPRTEARVESPGTRQSLVQEFLYAGFFFSLIYVGATLPCGRFYYENVEGFLGNTFLRLSFQYVYLYLGLLAHLVVLLEALYLSFWG